MSLALLAALRTCRTFEAPSNLLDPKVIPFEALLVLPVFRGARTECQAMAAESERGWVPRPQRSHQVRNIEYTDGQEAGILGRREGSGQVNGSRQVG
jgi:hypothetical protein